MKLYYDPASTVCRPVLFFIAEQGVEIELEYVSLFAGQHMEPAYLALNPSRTVPFLIDGDLALAESTAILQYLAEKVGSPAYPTDLKARARINAALAWLKSNFYRDYGIGCYSQLFPHHSLSTAEANAEMVAKAFERASRWFTVLNDHMLGDRDFIVGDEVTLADYMGVGIVSLGELVGFDLSPWPNVQRWLAGMKSRPAWPEIDAAFQGWLSAIRAQAA